MMIITAGFYGLRLLACACSTQCWAAKCRDEQREIKEELRRRGSR